MIIIGAGGFAKELMDVCKEISETSNLAFYDDINLDGPKKLYNFPILNNLNDLAAYFKNDTRFVLGIGNSKLRSEMVEKLEQIGGELTSLISSSANIGKFDVIVGEGATILPNAVVANGSVIGTGCLIYHNVQITHDTKVGDYAEFSPGAVILGKSSVGNFTQVGANATILPGINVGSNCIIGAGAVVTKNVPDNSIAVGVPAVVTSRD